MEFRYPADPEDVKGYTTERLRDHYHIGDLFTIGKIKTVYAHEDRMIIGGVCPKGELPLEESEDIGAAYFLERRELGAVNIGGKGRIEADGETYEMDRYDGLYLGMGTRKVTFASRDSSEPAKFYISSAPAHARYPAVRIDFKNLQPSAYGSSETSSRRSIYQYIAPGKVESCQLTVGLTILDQGNVWNTMPCHLHDRRMEVYFYFDMSEDARVFHFMGRPDQTRHIVVRNEEVVLSPSWSIHSGAGTKRYSFIWSMGGENKLISDVQAQSMDSLL